jgi:uncharacterized protein YcnI
MSSPRPRILAATGLTAVLVLALAGPAAAHVTLHSTEAVQGGSDALVQVRVPNEQDNASVTQLEVDFPSDSPLIGLDVQPTPGWSFQVTNSNLPKPITTDDGTISQYVSKVVWQGGNIPVGGFQDFDLDVSQLPTVATLTVKALQTYSNGDVVRWIELPGPQGQVPDHPAPTLALAPATQGPVTTAPATTAPAAAAPADASDLARKSAVSTADTLGVVGIVLGTLGLIGVGLTWTRSRRPI